MTDPINTISSIYFGERLYDYDVTTSINRDSVDTLSQLIDDIYKHMQEGNFDAEFKDLVAKFEALNFKPENYPYLNTDQANTIAKFNDFIKQIDPLIKDPHFNPDDFKKVCADLLKTGKTSTTITPKYDLHNWEDFKFLTDHVLRAEDQSEFWAELQDTSGKTYWYTKDLDKWYADLTKPYQTTIDCNLSMSLQDFKTAIDDIKAKVDNPEFTL